MAKKFEIYDLNGFRCYEGRPSHWAEFQSELFSIRNNGVEGQGRYYVSGKEVTFEEALVATFDAEQAFVDKRNETHRQITVHIGASSCRGTYHKVWVRK